MKRKGTIIMASLGLLIILTIVYGMLGKQVTIIDGQDTIQVVCFKSSVEDLIEEQGIMLEAEDRIAPPPGTLLKDGLEVIIERAVPFSVAVDGEVKLLMTPAHTVGEALNRAGIQTTSRDIIEPDVNSPVESDMEVTVVRVSRQTVKQERDVPFETIVKYNHTMLKGMENVVEKGQVGKIQEEIMVVYHDGNEVSRQKVNQEVLIEPANRIVERGTNDLLATSRGTVNFKKAIKMSATAYDATFESTGKNPGHPQYGITRSGTHVRPGVVAVDPKVIPLGTKLYVKSLDGSPDYGFASAEDTGGAIKGNKIDLYFESPADVKKFGRRNVLVYILE